MAKRAFDVVVSACALVTLAPMLLLIGLIVLCTSPGGALFTQQRVGRFGRRFRIMKFRTMRRLSGDEQGQFDLGSVSRVTKVGAVLRATKLDELPQLLNVLAGQMSIVGPRPEVPDWTTVYPERWKTVHTVRPGITDLASIEFRDEESLLACAPDPKAAYRSTVLPRKLDLAERYIASRTFVGDILIILRTVIAVVVTRSQDGQSGTTTHNSHEF